MRGARSRNDQTKTSAPKQPKQTSDTWVFDHKNIKMTNEHKFTLDDDKITETVP